MKILFYNWVPIYKNGIGGGVAVYLKNIANFLKEKHSSDLEIVFFNSGFYYDKKNNNIRIIKDQSYLGFDNYSIINSPLIAPHNEAKSGDFQNALKDENLKLVLKDFLIDTGPYDIIHFHSYEGLTPNILSLKKDFPDIKFIHSIHDYGIFCRNVKFWTYDNKNCVECGINNSCVRCSLVQEISPSLVHSSSRSIHHLNKNFYSSKFFNRLNNFIIRKIKKSLKILSGNHIFYPDDSIFKTYRKLLVDNINNHIDKELAVSNRVKEIASNFGINENKLITSYIGTKVAEKVYPPQQINPDDFTILYMGYTSVQKGFLLYLSNLENLNNHIAKKINLRFASKFNDQKLLDRTKKLESKFKSIKIYNGYSHEDLPMITQNVSLGVVPPIWEDNLPQVTMEMIAHGIPVLTGSYGGAHELNTNPLFTFGKKPFDLKNRIEYFFNNHELLIEYWKTSKPLTKMEDHIKELLRIYDYKYKSEK